MPGEFENQDYLGREISDRRSRKSYYSWSVIEGYTDRSFDEHLDYLGQLGFTPEAWQGKLLLDIGSGKGEFFAREASTRGIDVISLNPNLADEKTRLVYREPIPTGRSVAGIAQELPFKDNAFDAEISIAGVPLWLLPQETEYRSAFQEVIRTLKPGGRAYLFPVPPELVNSKIFKDIEHDLAKVADIGWKEVTVRDPKVKDGKHFGLIVTKHPA